MIKAGVMLFDLCGRDRVQGNLLMMAASYGRADIAKLLIDTGANVYAKDNQDRTPLYWVVREEHADVVKLLIAKGADAIAQDVDGVTPLQLAAGHETIFRVLIENAANIYSNHAH